MFGREIEPSALAVLGFAYLSERRESKGVSKCEKLMRGIRQHIGLETDTEIIPLSVTPDSARAALRTAQEARKLLDGYCRRCGQCQFGRPR